MTPSPLSRIRRWRDAVRAACALACIALSSPAQADTRASLDRDRIMLGESVTLTIESDAGVPDVAPLTWDFKVTTRGQGTRLGIANGNVQMRGTYNYELQPRRAGVVLLPPLRVGTEQTAALNLAVDASAPSRAGGMPRGDVHIESMPDTTTPYVQQAVGWTVRLYSALPIMSGRIDQSAPEGASLTRVGDDVQSTREINGRRYTVVERRYLLIAERSGALQVPGPTFEGRAQANFFEDLFGRRGDTLDARGTARTLRVRAVPAAAAQPWLPLHGLRLEYKATPQTLAAGAAGTLTVQLVADGATPAQLPELQLPSTEGLQVFPEPAATTESFAGGRPRATITRSFSLVPTRSGAIELAGLRIGWWDVARDRAATAQLRPLRWTVAPSASLPPPAPVPSRTDAPADVDGSAVANGAPRASRGWIIATVLFALAWLATLVWALQRRDMRRSMSSLSRDGSERRWGSLRTPDADSAPGTTMPPAPSMHALRQALQTGDFTDVFDVLMAMSRPPVHSVDVLIDRLDDTRQQHALRLAQRARYGGGDGTAARDALRGAFADGPRWRLTPAVSAPLLPPLYPN